MKLRDRLSAVKREFESGAPPYNATAEIIALQHRATNELITSGAADRALKVGDRAPIFALQSESGAVVRSDVLLARGPLVASFYRGVWCPYCNLELEALQEALPEIEARGATLVAVSPQTSANSRNSKRKTGAVFDILSDPSNAIARRFGLAHRLPDYLIAGVHKPLGADLTIFNRDDRWELPMPARYIIEPSGEITYAAVHPDYTTRPEPEDLYETLGRLAQKNQPETV